jgi:5-methyltetrahydropteroyltriglutamate--homocysteine methyltransferase
MTVAWTRYAQSLTKNLVKSMWHGRSRVCNGGLCGKLISRVPRAVANRPWRHRAEVLDLESAGVDVVQIDEPAIREGLPLRDADRQAYLGRAVGSFRLSYFGVKDSTQIHTHPCATPEI